MNTTHSTLMPNYGDLAKNAGRKNMEPIIGGFPDFDVPQVAAVKRPAVPANQGGSLSARKKLSQDVYQASWQPSAAKPAVARQPALAQPSAHAGKRRILRNLLCG